MSNAGILAQPRTAAERIIGLMMKIWEKMFSRDEKKETEPNPPPSTEDTVAMAERKVNRRSKKLLRQKEDDEKPRKPFTEEELKNGMSLLKDKALKDLFLQDVHGNGYLGRDKILLLVKLVCLSRLFTRGLSLVLAGTASTGKSSLIEAVLRTCAPGYCEQFTRTSAQYLLYRREPLDHRIIVYFELQGAGHAAEAIKTALTEGSLSLGTVQKDFTGELSATRIEKDAAGMVVLTTFTGLHLDFELDSRVLVAQMVHDPALAREVYRAKAQRRAHQEAAEDSGRLWQAADSLILPAKVQIPFLVRIAEEFPVTDERFHRDFDKVDILIRASAIWHQFQRARDNNNAIIADERDYRLVYELADVFIDSVLSVNERVLALLALVRDKQGMSRGEVQRALQVGDRQIRRYVDQAADCGYLETKGTGPGQILTVIEIPTPPIPILPAPEKIF